MSHRAVPAARVERAPDLPVFGQAQASAATVRALRATRRAALEVFVAVSDTALLTRFVVALAWRTTRRAAFEALVAVSATAWLTSRVAVLVMRLRAAAGQQAQADQHAQADPRGRTFGPEQQGGHI